MAASAVSGKVRPAFVVQDRLGHDGARRVTRAQEKYVIRSLHRRYPLWLRYFSLRLLCPDKCAYELAVHLRRDGVHVNPLFVQEYPGILDLVDPRRFDRSEEHTSELQS